jgi:GT2 family glycosyltransferase
MQKWRENNMSQEKRNVTIIVPVYGDWPSLSNCIKSLIKNVSSNNKVLFVNDCGPEADLIEDYIKKSIKGVKNFEYYRNPYNLGFLKNCNRAVFELDKSDNDIMLLNSDTVVTEGFLEAMCSVLHSDAKIASVSPRTNNATIATIPIISAKQKGINPTDAYKLFKSLEGRLPQYNIAPVAHGFCILIKRSVIDNYGLFDEAFGKGYGEETDFCMRVSEKGYKNAICNRAFVYHLEARSFSFEVKNKLLEINGAIIDKRYPKYRRLVRDYTESIIDQEYIAMGGQLSHLIVAIKKKYRPLKRRVKSKLIQLKNKIK